MIPNRDEHKLLSLQFLRGVAALLVVHAHAIDSQIELHIGWLTDKTLASPI
jgi:peptidoglycan/LPS O-acetylase OafA/YrhL